MNFPSQSLPYRNARELVDDAQELKACPQVFAKLMDCLDDPDATFDQMGSIVQSDPTLAARVLQVVNSPFYKLTQKVSSIQHGIEMLGISDLTSLVLATSVISHFRKIPQDVVSIDSFWTHSICTAVAAVTLAERLEHPQKSLLYSGGILHDIGSLLLYTQAPEAALQALERCNQWGMNLVDAEEEVLGFDHADIGYALAESWNLPENLQTLLAQHHNVSYEGACEQEVRILNLADYIAQGLQLGTSGEYVPRERPPESLTLLNLEPKELQAVSAQVLTSYKETVDILLANGHA